MRPHTEGCVINKDYDRFVQTSLLINGKEGAKGDSLAFGKVPRRRGLCGVEGAAGIQATPGPRRSHSGSKCPPACTPSPRRLRDVLPGTQQPPSAGCSHSRLRWPSSPSKNALGPRGHASLSSEFAPRGAASSGPERTSRSRDR